MRGLTGMDRKMLSRMQYKGPSESSSSHLPDNVRNKALDLITLERYRQPIVTGTSVLAIKYKDGIMMAADNLGE